MNEIVIFPDKSRQIVGDLAHKLAFGHDEFLASLTRTDLFHVVELTGDEPILRATQTTVRGAHSYLNPDRVLVYWQESPMKPEIPTGYKVWISIEPVDEDGEKTGEDLDLPFAYSALFRTTEAAQALAKLMHDHGRNMAPYVEAKHESKD